MNIGRELVACALREGTLRPFIEAGISREWLTDERDVSRAAVFDTEDMSAWMTLVRYHEQHGKTPSTDIFRRSHPEESYRLPETGYTPDELTEIFRQERRKYLVNTIFEDITDRIGEDNFDSALELMERSVRLIRETYARQAIVVDWDSPDYDVEARIHREVKQGVLTGIPGLDKQFYGFQPGNLICYLGRAKAGKTSFALLSAMRAWEDNKRVLFLSFEIAAGKVPSEPGIADRLDCFGSGIDLIHYMMGDMLPQEKDRLREFRKTCNTETFRIVQPTGKYTIDDLQDEVDRYRPDVVYVDGFYFMYDPDTGKSGANWEAHDNLASGLKQLGMMWMIPVIITHQVREKQLTGKKGKGIDDGAMMGGTGIIMFADMVFGADVDDEKNHMLSTTRSRLRYLDTVYGTWDWSVCEFTERPAPQQVDAGQFDYGKDNEDAPF